MQTAPTQFPIAALRQGPAASTKSLLLGLLALVTLLLAWPDAAQAERIKDLAAVQGVRTNKLTGVGLVVGLDGTGDQTTQVPQTTQGLMSMLQQFGIVVPPGTTVQTRNIAIVAVTAELPPFAKPGQEIDVTVLSQGNSKSLRGGSLLASPLKGLDGQVYAIAQGNLIVGGAGASAGGSKVQINSLNAGRIPGGATVERSVPTPLLLGDSIQLALNSDDYSTARLVARAINENKGSGTAQALDGRTVRVAAPTNPDDRINFLADLENLKVDLMAPSAKVVINARTGSIVMNQAVTLNACAIAHGNLAVTITSTPQVSQPGPLSNGQTTVTTKTDISIKQEPGVLIQLPASAKLADVVKALNSLGATPGDLVTILQAMKSAGALSADLEVI
ncbi:MAG: flagellar basal body P-ring protein FlgI [Burkholderiaceae bacterium]|nr:flagellar basal body P-ring protein FlgI [Burkholderiaceae bacterium]